MVELTLKSGPGAAQSRVADRFPFLVGRSSSADFPIEAKGVWDEHFELSLADGNSIKLAARPPALTLVNGAQVSEALLRNGDVIQAGQATLRFGLSAARPKGFRAREAVVWASLALLTVAQAGLIWWLLP